MEMPRRAAFGGRRFPEVESSRGASHGDRAESTTGACQDPAVWFDGQTLVLDAAQAACVAAPAAGLPAALERWRRSGWALVAPLSIAVVIGGIALAPGTADVLTWVALIGVPIGAAIALGWAMRGGARPPLAALVAPLLAVAWATQHSRAGQLAALVLVVLCNVAIGRLLAGGAPLDLLKLGVVVMAIVDSILVFSNQLQHPNAILEAASPGLGLPRLQSVAYGGATMGFGDLFAAAVVGGIFAAEGWPPLRAAVALLIVALLWDQLFLRFDTLPATVPPALVLVGAELWRRTGAHRRRAS
jgi:hypothetical protein